MAICVTDGYEIEELEVVGRVSAIYQRSPSTEDRCGTSANGAGTDGQAGNQVAENNVGRGSN